MQNWLFDVRSRPFLILSVAFIVMALLVHNQVTKDFDTNTLLAFQSAAGNHTVDVIMWIVTEIGDVRWLMLFSIVLLIIRPTRRTGLILLLSLVAGTIATGYIKGYLIANDSPDLEFLGTKLPSDIGKDTFVLGTGGSFPSGHATRASMTALIIGYALSRRFPKGCYLIWIFPVVEAISRLYVLQHFPMDVFGGFVFGILMAGIIGRKLKLVEIFKKSQT